jgi:lycopene cyclase domain-containing protein
MTYFGFLVRFVFIPIVVLLAVSLLDKKQNRRAVGFQENLTWGIISIHVILALVYTTPWDNYLVATGVWSYNPQLVSGLVFGWVPVEEYTFFVVETILSALWWLFLARRNPKTGEFRSDRTLVRRSAGALVIAWLLFTVVFFSGWKPGTYLSITLFWALPAIIPQLLFGADILWHYRKLVFLTIFPMALYLSLIDIVALKASTWAISPAQTTGIVFFQILPLEEVLFFFITNVLIGFGMTLMLSDLSQQRFATWRVRGFKGLP